MNSITRRTKHVWKLFAIAVLLFAMILPMTAQASDSIQADKDPHATSLQKIVDRMQPGWNLGNTFDAVGSDETAWGNPRVTKEFIDKLKQQGFRSIRIPVTWQPHLGAAPDYKIDPAYLDRVQQVVDWALDDGLYVMINMHHDSWLWVNQWKSNHDSVSAEYKAVWTQIADRFKDEPNKLLFESINEPRFSDGWGAADDTDYAALDELNTTFVHLVRQSGGNNDDRPLVLPGYATSSSQNDLDALSKTMTSLNDPNLVMTFHYYGFWPFSVNIAGTTTFDDATRNDLIDTFNRVHDMFVAKGIPVILGEYGLLGFDTSLDTVEQGEKLKYFEFLTYYAREKDITTMLWDNGQHFNRTTYQWSDPDLYAIMKAGWKTRSSTTTSDLVYVPKGQEAQDTHVQLNDNGNLFISMETDAKVLKRGQDYTLEGNDLTLKADLLKRLTATGKLGEAAVLTLRFNHGADWHLHILLADTPTLEAASGTTDAFAIPTNFNGDRLATMEAVYADGTNAGPQNWTPYKQFGSDFSPVYDKNEIQLLPAFFKEVKDGSVTLKFHFWSGTVLTYTIDKNGTAVTGANP